MISTSKKIKKVKQACLNCKRRKVKCTGNADCLKCVEKGLKCEYKTDPLFHKTMYAKESFSMPIKNRSFKLINKFKMNEDKIAKNGNTMNMLESRQENFEDSHFYNAGNGLSSSFRNEYNQLSSTSFKELGLCKLPSRSDAFLYMQTTWNIACISFRFYHRPTVYKLLESIYDMQDHGVDIHDIKNYNYEQRKALPLFYLIFAMGVLFINEANVLKSTNGSNQNENIDAHMNNFIHQINQLEYIGLNYFESGKKLTNFITASDNRTIQTLFMMSLYCQFTARLTESYTYNSLALTLLIKKGFYKHQDNINLDPKNGYNPLQLEVVKRMFWASYKTEIYMSTILGYPVKLKLDDITQQFPIDTNDENISDTTITMDNETDMISSCGINNLHTRLMLMMYEIKEFYNKIDIKSQYAAYASESPKSELDANILLEFVSHVENCLDTWVKGLPDYLKPSTKSSHMSEDFLRINKLLQLDYLNIKLMLYKPFLIENAIYNSEMIKEKCVNTCVEIINLSQYMWNRGLLVASYWFSQYTIFFAIGVLSSLKKKLKENFDDVLEVRLCHGIELVNKLKNCSATSMFIFNELMKIFQLDNSNENNTYDIEASVENLNDNINIFNDTKKMDGEHIFEGMEFFEEASGTPFASDKIAGNTIFDQFNNLFR